MQLMISILGAILAIFLIIVLHELGHFAAARFFGIRVLRFSVGFGRTLYKWVGRGGTEYILALIPLGGYVKMHGEGAASPATSEDAAAFNNKPLWVRMVVVLAGPCTNFLLALLVFWGAALIGIDHITPTIGKVIPGSFAAVAQLRAGDRIVAVGDVPTRDWQQVIVALLGSMGDATPVPLTILPQKTNKTVIRNLSLVEWKIDQRDPLLFESLGMLPYVPIARPIVQRVIVQSPAAQAGFLAGDEIKALNARAVDRWSAVVKAIAALPQQRVQFTVLRNGQLKTLSVQLGAQQRDKATVGYLGVMIVPPPYPPSMLNTERYTWLTAWSPALSKVWMSLQYNVIVLAKMLTAKLSLKTMGGPISILQAAGQSTQAGLSVYLSFIGFISLTIGFINLLPIPGLDGGHLLFQLIEGFIGRPVPDKIQHYSLTFGLLFVLLLIVHATINDLLRLFG